MTQTLAEQIRSARERRGWTQEQLAVHADVSRSTIQNLENGRRSPHRGSLNRIADALGVTVDALKAHTGGGRVDAQEVRDALEAAMKIEDPEEMRAALLELLARMPPASDDS